MKKVTDKARLDWLLKGQHELLCYRKKWWVCFVGQKGGRKTGRQAIDSAMRASLSKVKGGGKNA